MFSQARISVAESQTFLLAKRSPEAMSEEKRLPFACRLSFPLHDFDAKLPNFTFYVEREIKTTIFIFFFLRLNRPLEFNARKIRQHLKI